MGVSVEQWGPPRSVSATVRGAWGEALSCVLTALLRAIGHPLIQSGFQRERGREGGVFPSRSLDPLPIKMHRIE